MTGQIGRGLVALALGLAALGGSAAQGQGRTGVQTAAERALDEGNLAFEQGRLEDAGEAYRKAISLDPMLVQAYERYSILLFGIKRYRDGERLSRQALARHPGSAALKAQLGMHLFRLGRNQEAYAQLKPSIGELRDRFEVQYVAGLCFLQASDYRRAQQALDAYLSSRPARLSSSDPSAQAVLATALVKLGELQRASKVLDQVLRVQPKNATAGLAHAELLLKTNEYSRAVALFEHLRTKEKVNVDGLLLGQAYFGARRFQGALREADAYLRDHPSSYPALLLRGDAALALNQNDRALADFQRAAVLSGGGAEIKTRIAEVWLRQGKYKEALAQIAVQAARPDADPATLQLGIRAAVRARKFEEAAGYAERLAERAGSSPENNYYAGVGFSSAGKYELAGPLLEKAVALKHHNARRELVRTYCQLALRAHKKGEQEAATATLKKALKQEPGSLVVNRNLALVYLAQGQPKAALTHLELILRRVPGDFITNRLAGRAYLAIKDYKQAAARLELATSAVLKLGGLALARALSEAATAHLRLGETDRAILELERALRLVQLEQGVPELLVDVRGNLARAHFARAQALTGDEKRAWLEMQRSLTVAEALPVAERAALQLAAALSALSAGQLEIGKQLVEKVRSKAGSIMQPPYDKLAAPFLDGYLDYASPSTDAKMRGARAFEKLAGRAPQVRERLLALARSAYMQAAVQLFKAHRRREAKAALAKALRIAKTTSAEERHNLAVLDYFSGNRAQAVTALRGMTGRVAMALCNLAVHEEEAGAAQGAYHLFRQCEQRGAPFPGLRAIVESKRRVFGEAE